MDEISDLLIKTIISALPTLSHMFKSCQPDDIENSMLFEVLGIDIMIDEKGKPWLLEVNHSPSFKTDASLDFKIKKALISDTVRLINLNSERKMRYIRQAEKVRKERVLKGKREKLDPEVREKLKKEAMEKRDKFEESHMGRYVRIYPKNENSEAKY